MRRIRARLKAPAPVPTRARMPHRELVELVAHLQRANTTADYARRSAVGALVIVERELANVAASVRQVVDELAGIDRAGMPVTPPPMGEAFGV